MLAYSGARYINVYVCVYGMVLYGIAIIVCIRYSMLL